MGAQGNANGLPAVMVGAERYWSPADLGVNALAIGVGATVRSGLLDLRGFRNVTFYLQVNTDGTTTVTLKLEAYTPGVVVIRATTVQAGINQASGMTANDAGFGTTLLPGAVFGFAKLAITQTAGNAGTVTAHLAARH